MIKSTGSKLLDENTVDWALKHWSGPPNATDTVPVTYKLIESKPVYGFPLPPYPEAAVKKHIDGIGQVRVTFDAKGNVISAIIAESTGSAILDANTIKFAKANWHANYGKAATITVPIYYKLQ